jgi:hypothetical protein
MYYRGIGIVFCFSFYGYMCNDWCLLYIMQFHKKPAAEKPGYCQEEGAVWFMRQFVSWFDVIDFRLLYISLNILNKAWEHVIFSINIVRTKPSLRTYITATLTQLWSNLYSDGIRSVSSHVFLSIRRWKFMLFWPMLESGLVQTRKSGLVIKSMRMPCFHMLWRTYIRIWCLQSYNMWSSFWTSISV